MRYAKQKQTLQQSYRIGQMDGIDRSSFANEDALQDACNLTSDGKPYWKTRPARGRWHRVSEIEDETNSGLFVLNDPVSGACSLEDGLCWTTGTKIYIGGKEVADIELQNTEKKQLLPMGRELFVVPDGVLLYRDEDGIWQKRFAAAKAVVFAENLQFGGCNADATQQIRCTSSAADPASPSASCDWLDTSVSPAVLKKYNETDSTWSEYIPEAWFFTVAQLDQNFRVGDVVDITAAGLFYFRSAVVTGITDKQIIVQGIPYPDTNSGNTLIIGRTFPVIDHAVVCGNRIWGCRYGENEYGEFVNEIFCSALGDPLCWNRFGTGADDCYGASLGEPGAFTGAAVLYDDVLFFKENAVICISGSEPAAFRVACNEGRGVRIGCEKSVVRLGSSVVYCGCDGIYRTNGVYTVRLCDGFPPTALENAVGGVIGEKYYLAAQNQSQEYRMFVFTAGQDTYHCEDNGAKVQFFVPQRNCLYMLCMPSVTQIAGVSLYWFLIMITDCNAPGKYTNCLLEEGKTESDYGYAQETDISWYALTSELNCATDRTKHIREVNVCFELGESSLFCVELRTDRGERKQLCRFTGKGLRSRTLHVSALPCETVQLYFYGHGVCTVRNVEIVYETAKGEISRVQ